MPRLPAELWALIFRHLSALQRLDRFRRAIRRLEKRLVHPTLCPTPGFQYLLDATVVHFAPDGFLQWTYDAAFGNRPYTFRPRGHVGRPFVFSDPRYPAWWS